MLLEVSMPLLPRLLLQLMYFCYFAASVYFKMFYFFVFEAFLPRCSKCVCMCVPVFGHEKTFSTVAKMMMLMQM